MKRWFFILSILLSSSFLSGQSAKKLLLTQDFRNQNIDNQWVYVKLNPDQEIEPSSEVVILKKTNNGPMQNLMKLRVPDRQDPISFCNQLRLSNNYIYADPIVQYQLLAPPSDPLITNQYYLDLIKAEEAWEITKGDDDITIGIIDSGLDLDHEDLSNNLWVNTEDPIDGIDNDENGYIDDYYGYDFADVDNDPTIQNGNHGIIVGGIAGATTNNGKGIAGVGYNTKVAALKGFKSSNGFSGGLYEAITYAGENGMDVVNLSWGRMGLPLQSEQDIIDDAVLNYNMVVVAAAGNEGGKSTQEEKWYPASYNHVLSVGASDDNDIKSSGSTFNYSVDLLAPGVSIYSTFNNNGYGNGGPGTSYASPQVAAAAALVKDKFPSLTAIQIMERVRVTADDIYDVGGNDAYEGKLGKGRLNVHRAVSESNVKSIRATDPVLSSKHGSVFFGDTVVVTASITNFLSQVNDPFISISSPDNLFTTSVGSFMPGYLGTGDSKNIEFEVILDEDIAPKSVVPLRIDYSAFGYQDFQFLEVSTSPDYFDFGNDKVKMTISGDGDLGFNEYGPNYEGSGFQYQLDTLMAYTGLMIATDATSVSDNFISNYVSESRNQDFQVQKFYKLYHHQAADLFGYSEFSDSNHPIIIEQSNISWESEDFLVIRYRVVNNSASTLNNISVGIFADWNLDDQSQNYAEYNLTDDYIFTRNSADNLYAGVKVIGDGIAEYSALDLGTFNGNSQDIETVFDDATKYDFLVNQNKPTAGSMGPGNDVATINGVTIGEIHAFDESFVNVIYAIADSKISLETELQNAEDRLNEFLLKPRVLETFYTCDGASFQINPADGENFDFYEDPFASTLISSGSSLNTGTITKDTTFYVKNIDNGYPSDVFEIRVNLLDQIADFSMSSDTLYLDHPTTNIVQFTDLSLNAISWEWDFDEGTQTTIQNPSLSFAEPGSYNITLSIENEQGCFDTINKTLVIANRPDNPVLSDIVICPNENALVNDPAAETLHLFAFEDQTVPTLSGLNLEIGPIAFDTTIFVSGVYGSFESKKIPLQIDVMEVSGSFTTIPDTTSTAHQMLFSATQLDEESTIRWFIDGELAGSDQQVTTEAVEGDLNVLLEITSADGCTKTIEKNISISTSTFAFHQDLVSCFGDEVMIEPENGTYFGFYADAELSELIKKGTSLRTSEYDKVYVVGLDDGLPGVPIEVNISNEVLEIEVSYDAQAVGEKQKVDFLPVSDNEIISYKWYIDGVLSETIQNPTFFFDNTAYAIVLTVESSSGCMASDSLTLDFTPPLGLDLISEVFIYPNPSSGFIHLIDSENIEQINIYSLDGKQVLVMKEPKSELNLSELNKGVYILEIRKDKEVIEGLFLLR